MMTRVEEIKKEIERLETLQFYLAMKDRWNHDDFILDGHYTKRLFELKKELEELA